jgi:21S rRNA (GM2251-2'-O)-methyltransferase
MSLVFRRQLSGGSALLQAVKPAVRSRKESRGFEAVERNLPKPDKLKAWDKAGESKDEFFTKRYSHVHAKRIQNDNPKRREAYTQQRDDRKRERYQEQRTDRFQHKRKFESKDIYKKFDPNPFSEFIYGTSSVVAALRANKREFFNKLLVYNPESKDKEILALAHKLGVKTVFVDSKNDLNRITNNGIHNGYVLETKPLTPQPIIQLGEVIEKDYTIDEDNYGDLLPQPYQTKNINPLGIYVDGVSDPHNIGAIIRSAYFLGADFLVMSEKNNAKLSPVVTKTSVGATEFLPIMSATKPLQFFEKSKENGWSFISAGSIVHHKDATISQTLQSKSIEVDELNSVLEKSPVVLVLGSEGEGIRTTLKLRSDFIVGIKSGPHVDRSIDSLNVSVAAALLIQKTLQG